MEQKEIEEVVGRARVALANAKSNWDESKHPRGPGGRFGKGSGVPVKKDDKPSDPIYRQYWEDGSGMAVGDAVYCGLKNKNGVIRRFEGDHVIVSFDGKTEEDVPSASLSKEPDGKRKALQETLARARKALAERRTAQKKAKP